MSNFDNVYEILLYQYQYSDDNNETQHQNYNYNNYYTNSDENHIIFYQKINPKLILITLKMEQA